MTIILALTNMIAVLALSGMAVFFAWKYAKRPVIMVREEVRICEDCDDDMDDEDEFADLFNDDEEDEGDDEDLETEEETFDMPSETPQDVETYIIGGNVEDPEPTEEPTQEPTEDAAPIEDNCDLDCKIAQAITIDNIEQPMPGVYIFEGHTGPEDTQEENNQGEGDNVQNNEHSRPVDLQDK